MRRSVKAFVLVVAVSIVVPAAAASAAERPAPIQNIRILKNADFTAANGVSSGSGTKSDPYVFTGLELNNIHIENTSKYVEIRNNMVAGQLLLDWIGDRASVHHNKINNLTVNRNVRRTGAPTSGTIVRNTIGVVGQLRHWDGLFAYNVVGTRDQLGQRAANFDGFNGARYDRNTFYGFVDARLHGHHHSSNFTGDSHMHDGKHHALNHSERYHRTSVTNNTIYSNADYGLAYLDTGHQGNDRTAPSEQDKALNDPHAHHTRVRFAQNKLVGAGILVDVFNADNPKHKRTYTGLLEIAKNSISLRKDDFWTFKNLMGIHMRNAKDVRTYIDGNRVYGTKNPGGSFAFLEQWDSNAGIFLENVDKADVWITKNYVQNRVYGVRALNFTVDVEWFISGLKTKNVNDAVYYENVPRKPQAA